jgi:hypothetical protein
MNDIWYLLPKIWIVLLVFYIEIARVKYFLFGSKKSLAKRCNQ